MSFFESVAVSFQKGGPFMIAIGFVAVLALAISISRFIKLYWVYSIDSFNFMNQIIKLLTSNNVDRAIKACQSVEKAALPQVMKAGLLKLGKPMEDIQGAMEEASLRVIPKLQSGLNFIAMFANIATLLGLLGTISGLITAFKSVSLADPSLKQQMLASGISEAMLTTAFGLIVAVPCIVIHTYLANKTSKMIDDIDRYSVAIVNVISEQYRMIRNKNV